MSSAKFVGVVDIWGQGFLLNINYITHIEKCSKSTGTQERYAIISFSHDDISSIEIPESEFHCLMEALRFELLK